MTGWTLTVNVAQATTPDSQTQPDEESEDEKETDAEKENTADKNETESGKENAMDKNKADADNEGKQEEPTEHTESAEVGILQSVSDAKSGDTISVVIEDGLQLTGVMLDKLKTKTM